MSIPGAGRGGLSNVEWSKAVAWDVTLEPGVGAGAFLGDPNYGYVAPKAVDPFDVFIAMANFASITRDRNLLPKEVSHLRSGLDTQLVDVIQVTPDLAKIDTSTYSDADGYVANETCYWQNFGVFKFGACTGFSKDSNKYAFSNNEYPPAGAYKLKTDMR